MEPQNLIKPKYFFETFSLVFLKYNILKSERQLLVIFVYYNPI